MINGVARDVALPDNTSLLDVLRGDLGLVATRFGVGEVAQGPTAAAIGNAVADAIGVRIRDLPMTRERIIAAMSS